MIRWLAILVLIVALGSTAPVVAQQATDPPASDLLNAALWMQRSVEYKAGAYQSLPTAVILDIDETILDNSGYQSWMALKGTTFDPKTWNAYVNTVTSLPIPGALEFARYAD